jgi:hypothetical protein
MTTLRISYREIFCIENGVEKVLLSKSLGNTDSRGVAGTVTRCHALSALKNGK